MNIQEAKEEIKKTVRAYTARTAAGTFRIPVPRQRPVLLIGPPGIGKTAIMEQIAQELQIGIVSYSMTHHTRQSALGLPRIVHNEFEGFEYDSSEYTMSEIVSSIYDYMSETGLHAGILVPRRDQLRLRDAISFDASVPAVQDLWPSSHSA